MRSRLMHRLDPVSKFVWMFAVSFLAFGTFYLSAQVLTALVLFFFALVLARLSLRSIFAATWIFALACVSYVIVQSLLLQPQGTHLLVTVRLVAKPIYGEVIEYASAVGLRIYTVFVVALVFIRTTHPRDLAVGFCANPEPAIQDSVRAVHCAADNPSCGGGGKTVVAAHRVRGIGERAGLKSRVENARRLTIPLLIRALRDASTTALSMECRAFVAYPRRTYVDRIDMTVAGKILTFGSIGTAILWYALIFAGVFQLRYSVS